MSNHNIHLNQAIDAYRARQTGRQLAATTIEHENQRLEQMSRGLADMGIRNPWVHQLDVATVEMWLFGPTGPKVGPSTFNVYIGTIDRFFEYGIQMDWITKNPVKTIPMRRPGDGRPKLYLSAAELLALMDDSRPWHRIALSVGMNTGLRANDIINLRIGDVNLTDGMIQTEIRKTRKLDVKPITADLAAEIDGWLTLYADASGHTVRSLPNDWLLVPSVAYIRRTDTWRPRSDRKIAAPHRIVHKGLERLNLPTLGEGFHTLRRSSARCLFEMLLEDNHARDRALMIVKDYLNHSTTAQTEVYLGLNQERTIRNQVLGRQSFLGAVSERDAAKRAATTELRGA